MDALPADDGEALVLTWWTVNNGFSCDGSGGHACWPWHWPARHLGPNLRRPRPRRALSRVLGHYTGRQLILYWKEAQAAERREQAREVRAVMFGMTGGKEATAFLNELES